MNFNTRHIILCILLILCSALQAQVYPVTATTTMRAPYSLSLADYANPTYDRIQTSLFLSDLSSVNYPVKIRLIIRGPGISLSTLPGQEVGPIFLNGGQTEILTGSELNGLFNPDKLQFAGITLQQYRQNAALPEGIYQVQMEVLDFNAGFAVSNVNIGFASAWLILNDPPIINTPVNHGNVEPSPLQSVFFQWTPRHTGSPNSAFTTQYLLQLVEIFPASRNANDAMLSSPPIMEATTFATSYNYTMADPTLETGKWYAFRIKAFDLNGLDLFKNQGFTEVYRFYYGYPCTVPENVQAELIDNQTALLTWDAVPNAQEYQGEYKKKNASFWTSLPVNASPWVVSGLLPGQEYLFRVKSLCTNHESDYSEESELATPSGSGKVCDPPVQENCSAVDENGTITVSWNTQPWFNAYLLHYREKGEINFRQIRTSTPTVRLSGLDSDKEYEYKIVYTCSKDSLQVEGALASFWISAKAGTGTGNCFPPAEMRHEVNKNLSATLSWPAEAAHKGMWVYYKRITESTWDSVYTGSNSTTLKNLSEGYRIQYYLKSVCDDGRLSIASDSLSFLVEYTGGSDCPRPTLKEPVILNPNEVKLSWLAAPGYTSYLVEYKTNTASTWQVLSTTDTLALLRYLNPDKPYQTRLYALCGDYKTAASDIRSFSTKSAVEANFACGASGSTPAVNNRNEIALKAGDIFYAAGFELTVSTLEGESPYQGTATAAVPYFKHSHIIFRMQGVRVNELHQLFQGKLYLEKSHLAVLDPAMAAQIQNMLEQVDQGFSTLEEYMDKVNELQDDINGYIDRAEGGNNVGFVKTGEFQSGSTVDAAISSAGQIQGKATTNGECELTLVDDAGNTQTRKVQAPATIEEKNGLIFSVDEGCRVSEGGKRVTLTQSAEELNALSDKATVIFNEASEAKLGFSGWRTSFEPSDEWKLRYQSIGTYRVASKFMEPQRQDPVKATIALRDKSLDKNKVVFISSKGVQYPYTLSGNTYTLSLLGGPESDAQEVFALYPGEDGQFLSFGKLLVPSYKHKQRQLVLIPVDGAKAETEAIQKTLNAVYNRYGIEWTVSADENFSDLSWNLNQDKDNALDVEGSNAFSTLTGEMKALTEAYRKTKEIVPTNAYMFVLKKAEKAGVTGDMPRAKQFGYLFTDGQDKEAQGLTAAHEMGHGLFLLKHIFDGYRLAKYSQPHNLMDYAGGSQLDKLQWDVMHDPGVVLGVFERDEDAEKTVIDNLDALKRFLNSDKKSYTFLTPAGKVISLPSTVKQVILYDETEVGDRTQFISRGSIYGFTLENGMAYLAKIDPTEKLFQGFVNGGANFYEDDISHQLTDRSVILGNTLIKYGCYYFSFYKRVYDVAGFGDGWPTNAKHRGNGTLNDRAFYNSTEATSSDPVDLYLSNIKYPEEKREFLSIFNGTDKPEFIFYIAKIGYLIGQKPGLYRDYTVCKGPIQNISSVVYFQSEYTAILEFSKGNSKASYSEWITNAKTYLANVTDKTQWGVIDLINRSRCLDKPQADAVSELTVEERIRALSLIVAEQSVPTAAETAIITLLRDIKPEDVPLLLERLEGSKSINQEYVGDKSLLNKLIEGVDGDNFTELIRILAEKAVFHNQAKYEALFDVDTYGSRSLSWNPDASKLNPGAIVIKEGIWSDYVELNAYTANISVTRALLKEFRSVYHPTSQFGGGYFTNEPVFETYDLVTYRPFDLVSVSSGLRLEAGEGLIKKEAMLVPAIMLYHDNNKRLNQSLQTTAEVTFDLASIALTLGGSTAYSTLSLARKAYLAYELTTGIMDVGITLSEASLSTDPEAKQLLKYYTIFKVFVASSDALYNLAKISKAAHEQNYLTKQGLTNALNEYEKIKTKIANGTLDPSISANPEFNKLLKYYEQLEERSKANWQKWYGENYPIQSVQTEVSIVISDDALLLGSDVANAKKFLSGSSRPDNTIDVVIHGDGNTYTIIINGHEHTGITHRTLSNLIKSKPEYNGKTIRLLSCSDLNSAQDLANKTGQNVIACEGSVKLFADGGITNTGTPWYLLQPGNKPRTRVENPRPPANSNEIKFIELGKQFDGKIKENDGIVIIEDATGKEVSWAEVNTYGNYDLLKMTIKTKNSTISGRTTINESIKYININWEQSIDGFLVNWKNIDNLTDNLDKFNEQYKRYIANGLSEENAKTAAYWDTFSGKMASELQFNKIHYLNGIKDSNGNFTSIEGVVTK